MKDYLKYLQNSEIPPRKSKTPTFTAKPEEKPKTEKKTKK